MKDIFKRLIRDFHEKDLSYLVERDIEIPADLKSVVTLIGVRRSGKTSLLYSLIRRLRLSGDPTTAVYLNLEDDRLFPLTLADLSVFLDAYYELYPLNREKTVSFFFDEVQNVPEWERFIRRLHDTENCRIFITGSSARLLGKEIATALRGRTVTYEVFPLSFREYLRFRGIAADTGSSRSMSLVKNALASYLIEGGFPETVGLSADAGLRILREYLSLIMYRDVMERHNSTNSTLLRHIIKYSFANIATLLSFNKLYNDFRSQGMQLSRNTLYDYFAHLEDAYALFTVPLFAASHREILRNPRKLYSIDHGLKRVVDLPLVEDTGRIMENVVFIELRRRFSEIWYVKGKQEVDFLVKEQEGLKLINVCQDMSQPDTRKRELTGMNEAMQRLGLTTGVIITAEEQATEAVAAGKVEIVALSQWLLDKTLGNK